MAAATRTIGSHVPTVVAAARVDKSAAAGSGVSLTRQLPCPPLDQIMTLNDPRSNETSFTSSFPGSWPHISIAYAKSLPVHRQLKSERIDLRWFSSMSDDQRAELQAVYDAALERLD
jgi:hypothetical protein